MTEGGPGRRDGLFVLRRQGLAAWVAHVTTAPPRPDRAPAVPIPATDPAVTTVTMSERSPLVCLCTDMLLATLAPKEVQ